MLAISLDLYRDRGSRQLESEKKHGCKEEVKIYSVMLGMVLFFILFNYKHYSYYYYYY